MGRRPRRIRGRRRVGIGGGPIREGPRPDQASAIGKVSASAHRNAVLQRMLRCGAPCIADNQRAALGLHSPAAKVAPSDRAGRANEENAGSSAPSTVLAETESAHRCCFSVIHQYLTSQDLSATHNQTHITSADLWVLWRTATDWCARTGCPSDVRGALSLGFETAPACCGIVYWSTLDRPPRPPALLNPRSSWAGVGASALLPAPDARAALVRISPLADSLPVSDSLRIAASASAGRPRSSQARPRSRGGRGC